MIIMHRLTSSHGWFPVKSPNSLTAKAPSNPLLNLPFNLHLYTPLQVCMTPLKHERGVLKNNCVAGDTYPTIMKWFTLHHVVDLKRSVCLFFFDSKL